MTDRHAIIAKQSDFEALVGEKLPDELFTIVPWGHRLVIVREKPIETTPGGIVVPETAKRPIDTGWVVSVGDKVGTDDRADYAGVCPMPPESLLGRRVTFGKYAGTALFPKRDTAGGVGYESRYVLLTDGDIMFHHQGDRE